MAPKASNALIWSHRLLYLSQRDTLALVGKLPLQPALLLLGPKNCLVPSGPVRTTLIPLDLHILLMSLGK